MQERESRARGVPEPSGTRCQVPAATPVAPRLADASAPVSRDATEQLAVIILEACLADRAGDLLGDRSRVDVLAMRRPGTLIWRDPTTDEERYTRAGEHMYSTALLLAHAIIGSDGSAVPYPPGVFRMTNDVDGAHRLEPLVRPEISREEWIARCAARLATGERMTPQQAYQSAVACHEYADDGETPEYAADEELLASAEAAA